MNNGALSLPPEIPTCWPPRLTQSASCFSLWLCQTPCPHSHPTTRPSTSTARLRSTPGNQAPPPAYGLQRPINTLTRVQPRSLRLLVIIFVSSLPPPPRRPPLDDRPLPACHALHQTALYEILLSEAQTTYRESAVAVDSASCVSKSDLPSPRASPASSSVSSTRPSSDASAPLRTESSTSNT